ncbi:mitochondrial carrier protein [Ceratobasidium sp. AG-Ba]|nr:mitochondrial carrier protein [Ceratobasidium sp. AG-Ba]
MSRDDRLSSGSALFHATLSGHADRPFIPRLRSDASPYAIPPRLEDYRSAEGSDRERRLKKLWGQLPATTNNHDDEHRVVMPLAFTHVDELTSEQAAQLRKVYDMELVGRCRDPSSMREGDKSRLEVDWDGFRAYANAKEAELWTIFHDELDLDGNGHLDADELNAALSKAGLELDRAALADFMASLSTRPHSHQITFPEFRDFLLLLPRKVSPQEIYQFYKVKKFLGDDGRGSARVNMEGDVSLSAEDRPPPTRPSKPSARVLTLPEPPPVERVDFPPSDHRDEAEIRANQDKLEQRETEEPKQSWLGGEQALKFLLAGGIAGAVSRTATAPFDRLKVYLITRQPEVIENIKQQASTPGSAGTAGRLTSATAGSARALGRAVTNIYAEGGLAAFWVGNGLNIVKIFPESAIKFLSYESSKRFFARYVDEVEDPRNISGTSRFISGGIGGITSQLETLKTQMMSTTGGRQSVLPAIKRLWALGGARAYYRGLTIGLVGVFPYSAIDMSTFEALKLAYSRSTGTAEPGVLALLAFGSISGSVGATSVYPLNLVRTRLQASGSSGHPQVYDGIWDVARKTMQNEGWRGFYKGLVPTLAKVVPAVSISYVVYENCKRRLGV